MFVSFGKSSLAGAVHSTKMPKRYVAKSEEVVQAPAWPHGGSTAAAVAAAASASAAAASVQFYTSFHSGRRLTLTTFNGQVFIHIREYTQINGKEYPSKKGACLTPGRLAVLRENMGQIDTTLNQQEVNASYNIDLGGDLLFKLHLGGGVYVTVSEKFSGVDIRRYWLPEGQINPTPTKNGIFLPTTQWKALKEKIGNLILIHPELNDVRPCADSHENIGGMVECKECVPFGGII